MLRRSLIIFLFLCLTSCGFHPRGEMVLSAPLQNLYLKTADPYGQLARNLKEYLKASGVVLASSPEDAATTLEILREDKTEKLLSVSGTQQTRQYSLILTVIFQINNAAGEAIVPPQSVSENRTLAIEADQILASSNEATMLYRQMEQAIGYDIMNRLASRDISVVLTTSKKIS